ncbi:hypothetical protein F190043G2_23050 [Blautia caecimuris]
MGMSGTCAGIYKYGVGIILGSSYGLFSASDIIRINTEDGEKICYILEIIQPHPKVMKKWLSR